jgi:hypothetical protein
MSTAQSLCSSVNVQLIYQIFLLKEGQVLCNVNTKGEAD